MSEVPVLTEHEMDEFCRFQTLWPEIKATVCFTGGRQRNYATHPASLEERYRSFVRRLDATLAAREPSP